MDFYRGRHSWSRFDNLVERLDRVGHSWTSAARATDVDAYRAARDAGLLRQHRGKHHTDPVEWSTTNQQLAATISLLQQLIHAVYVHQTEAARKKPKVTPWPAPRTAADMVRAVEADEVFTHLEQNVIRPVSREEYQAVVAAALAQREAAGDN